MWQHTQLTGTNSRTLGRLDPLLGPLRLMAKTTTAAAPNKPANGDAQASRGAAPTKPFGDPACLTSYFPGDDTWMVPPVPIPNTAVKHPGPMVVLRGRE